MEDLLLSDIADEIIESGEDLDLEGIDIDNAEIGTNLTESYTRYHEAGAGRASAIRRYIDAVGGDGSFEDFVNSEYNTYGETSKASFNAAYKSLLKQQGMSRSGNSGGEDDFVPQQMMNIDDINAADVSDEFKMIASAIDRSVKTAAEAGGSVEERVNIKFKRMNNLVRNLCRGRSGKRNVILAGSPGIGKTYTVKKVVAEYYPICTKNEKAVGEGEYSFNSGDIGTSISDVILFFFTHRHDNLIVLDDCDNFLSKKTANPKIANMLKALLNSNPEKVEINGKTKYVTYATVPSEISNRLNKRNGIREATNISIDMDTLLEEKTIDIYINDEYVTSSGRLNESEFKSFVNRLHEASDDDDDWDGDDDDWDGDDDEPRDDEGMLSQRGAVEAIPSVFEFSAPLLIISNLDEKDINDAVVTRCEVYQLNITPEEFLIRAGQIVDNLEFGEDSSFTEAEKTFAKKMALGGLKLAIDSEKKKIPLIPDSGPVKINKYLNFRCIIDLAGSFLAACDEFVLDNGIESVRDAHDYIQEHSGAFPPTLVDRVLSLNTLEEVVGFIVQPKWIRWDLIPYLEKKSV